MRKTLAAVALSGAVVLGGANFAFANNGHGHGHGQGQGHGIGNQCPKGTKGAHGRCVREIARHHGRPTTTTTGSTTTTTP